MKKLINFFLISLVIFTILTITSYAAGESTGGGGGGDAGGGGGDSGGGDAGGGDAGGGGALSDSASSSSSNSKRKAPVCKEYGITKDRIKCRLIYGEKTYSIPEPCRGISKQSECILLYKESEPCYKKDGVEKDQCLKNAAGFKEKSFKIEKSEKAKRNYILLLLYDLQERVEESYHDEKITSEQASTIIDSIVTAKLKITQKKSKQEIKTAIDDVKQKYEAVQI